MAGQTDARVVTQTQIELRTEICPPAPEILWCETDPPLPTMIVHFSLLIALLLPGAIVLARSVSGRSLALRSAAFGRAFAASLVFGGIAWIAVLSVLAVFVPLVMATHSPGSPSTILYAAVGIGFWLLIFAALSVFAYRGPWIRRIVLSGSSDSHRVKLALRVIAIAIYGTLVTPVFLSVLAHGFIPFFYLLEWLFG